MNPLRELAAHLTRRHFFGRAGLGRSARRCLRRCWRPMGCRRTMRVRRAARVRRHGGAAALCAQGEAGHLSVSVGRAVAAGAARLQAEAAGAARHGTARFDPPGPAAHRHDVGPEELSRHRAEVRLHSSAAERARGSASCCRTRPRSSTTVCLVRSMHTEAINHDPAITYIQTGSQQPGRPSLGAWLSYGLGARGRGPAGVRRADLARQRRRRQPGAARSAVGQRLSCRRAIRESSCAAAAIRCCISPIRRASTASCGARCSTAWPSSTSYAAPKSGDPEIATRIAQYEMAFRMQTSRARADRPVGRDRQQTFDAVRPDVAASRARSRRTACWPGGWSSAACGSCSSIIAAGTSTATCRATFPSRPRTSISRRRRSIDRSQAARAARRHAGRLGRRVRPHGLWPGGLAGRLRPRPSRPLLFDVAGRRRHQAGHRPRRDRRLRLQHRPRAASTSTT